MSSVKLQELTDTTMTTPYRHSRRDPPTPSWPMELAQASEGSGEQLSEAVQTAFWACLCSAGCYCKARQACIIHLKQSCNAGWLCEFVVLHSVLQGAMLRESSLSEPHGVPAARPLRGSAVQAVGGEPSPRRRPLGRPDRRTSRAR